MLQASLSMDLTDLQKSSNDKPDSEITRLRTMIENNRSSLAGHIDPKTS